MMTNELTRVIDAIKADPHGEVARKAAHWLAVNVMRWELKNDVRGRLYASWYVGESVPNPIDYVAFYKSHWHPFTDANHTRMLVKAGGKLSLHPAPMSYCERKRLSQGVTNASHDYPVQTGHVYAPHYAGLALNPYADDTTHDACQVLRKCHVEGALTNDELERWRA